MDVWQMTQVIVRRWYVFVPAVLLATFLTVSVGNAVHPEYTASNAVILMGPTKINQEQLDRLSTSNLYADSPEIAAAALKIALEGADVRRGMGAAGLSKDYDITPADFSPIVQIDVRADSRARAKGTVKRLLAYMRQDLKARQDGVGAPQNTRLTIVPVSATSVPEPDYPGKNRARLLVFGLGLGLSALLALWVDALLRSARRRQPARQALSVEGSPPGSESDGYASKLHEDPAGTPVTAGTTSRD